MGEKPARGKAGSRPPGGPRGTGTVNREVPAKRAFPAIPGRQPACPRRRREACRIAAAEWTGLVFRRDREHPWRNRGCASGSEPPHATPEAANAVGSATRSPGPPRPSPFASARKAAAIPGGPGGGKARKRLSFLRRPARRGRRLNRLSPHFPASQSVDPARLIAASRRRTRLSCRSHTIVPRVMALPLAIPSCFNEIPAARGSRSPTSVALERRGRNLH